MAETARLIVRRYPPGVLRVLVAAAVSGCKRVHGVAVIVAVVTVNGAAHQAKPQSLRRVVAQSSVRRAIGIAILVFEYGVGGAGVKAIGLEIRARQVEVDGVVAAADIARQLLVAVATALGAELAAETGRGCDGADIDHTAGVRAVHQALGTAQDFHPLYARAQDLFKAGADLWPGGVGNVDAVEQHQCAIAFLAPDAQGRRAAGTAGIGDGDSGLGAQHVVQRSKAQPGNLLLGDDGDGGAHLAQWHRDAGGRDHNLLQWGGG